jgi:hypothetical protein
MNIGFGVVIPVTFESEQLEFPKAIQIYKPE